MSKTKTKSPEEYFVEAIQLVQKVAARKEALHLTHCFTDSPRQSGVVAAFVVCPDEVARILHRELDVVIQRILNEHHLSKIEEPDRIQ